MKATALLAVCQLVFAVCGIAQQDGREMQKEDRLHWWRESRFGMFIHWGPVSLKGTEISWSRGGERRGIEGKGDIPVEVYDSLYRQFNPVKFNADEWVSIARTAGMKYMVLTAKHCDGFCLWRSGVDEYGIAKTPFKRDVCGELADAAHKAGMRIGWYYSPMDWRDPDCRTERNSVYVKRMQGHLRELLSNYGRIDLLWFDTDGGPAPWDQPATYGLVRSLQPRLIINNRLDMGSLEDYKAQNIGPDADYQTPEQRIGAFDNIRPWETCMTLGTQWSWKPQDRIKPFEVCLRILVQCVAGDGNLLLNVGPMPNGEIEPRQVEVLRQMGGWLAKYGESVYGTRGGPFRNGAWGGSTRRGNAVYLHILKWERNQLRLPPLKARIITGRALTGGNVRIEQTDEGTIIRIPVREQNKFNTVVKLEMETPVDLLEPVEVRGSTSAEMEGSTIRLKNPPSALYSAGGTRSLVDGVRGSVDHSDGTWSGFEGSDFEAVLDLHTPRQVSRVMVGCLQNQASWIFLPTLVEVSVSRNGKDFKIAGKVDVGKPQENGLVAVKDIEVRFTRVKAQYVRIKAANVRACPEWHYGAGGKAWVFVDEIVVE